MGCQGDSSAPPTAPPKETTLATGSLGRRYAERPRGGRKRPVDHGSNSLHTHFKSLVLLVTTTVDAQGDFQATLPNLPHYWIGVSGEDIGTYIDTFFVFDDSSINIDSISAPAFKSSVVPDGETQDPGLPVNVPGPLLGDINRNRLVSYQDAEMLFRHLISPISYVSREQDRITGPPLVRRRDRLRLRINTSLHGQIYSLHFSDI